MHHGFSHKPKERILDDGLQEWVWDISDIRAVEDEPSQPVWYEQRDWAQVSSFQNWQEVADAAQLLFVEPPGLSQEIKDFIKNLKNSYDDPKEIVTVIVRFVQDEIRYLSLDELGAYCVANPNDVFSRRYGDCKDKSWLLSLMLKEVGINSFPALVSTHWEAQTSSFLPSLQVFNHAILAIELDDKIYWIDSTQCCQGGRIDRMCQPGYGNALLVGHPRKAFVPIANGEVENGVHTRVTIDLTSDKEQAMMFIETCYLNSCADSLRYYCSLFSC